MVDTMWSYLNITINKSKQSLVSHCSLTFTVIYTACCYFYYLVYVNEETDGVNYCMHVLNVQIHFIIVVVLKKRQKCVFELERVTAINAFVLI